MLDQTAHVVGNVPIDVAKWHGGDKVSGSWKISICNDRSRNCPTMPTEMFCMASPREGYARRRVFVQTFDAGTIGDYGIDKAKAAIGRRYNDALIGFRH